LFAVYYKQTADKTKLDMDEHRDKDVSTLTHWLLIFFVWLCCQLLFRGNRYCCNNCI